MAVYHKLLKNKAGDTIIPVVGLADYLYPVGSIYMSATMSTAAQVEAALGGTWVSWGAGRVPVGVDTADTSFDTAEETGGEKTHVIASTELPTHTHTYTKPASSTQGHTLTTSQIPGHSHKASMIGIWSGTGTTTGSYGDFAGTTYWNHISTSNGVIFESYGPGTLTTQNNTGGGGSHSHSLSNTDNTATGNGGFANNAMNNLQPYITCYMYKRTA